MVISLLGWTMICFIFAFTSLYLVSCYMEFKDWNYGTCEESGQPWLSFSVDSSGAIGYQDHCGHTIWISYSTVRLANFIDKLRR